MSKTFFTQAFPLSENSIPHPLFWEDFENSHPPLQMLGRKEGGWVKWGGGGGGANGLLKSQFVRRKLHAANIFSLNFANKTFWNELLLARMSKSAQKNWQNREKSHWIKRSFDVMDLIHIRIYFNISNYKVNSKQSAFHSLKGSEIHYLLNTLCWMVA